MHRLAAALAYLEQGEWQLAHTIVQDDASALGCWLHGIVHRLEGDVENARYWYSRAQRPFAKDASIAAEISAAKQALG